MSAARILLLSLLLGPLARADGNPVTAEDLIARVAAAQETSGFRVRARLVRTERGSDQREVKQLLIKSRRDGAGTTVLYQALWPTAMIGQALVIEKSANQPVGGFLFAPPDKVTPLTPALLAQPFFGSDLTLEDLAEEYWRWPAQRLIGEETIAGHPCQILESRPRADTATGYSMVKTWIATDLTLPLRIEKFGQDGELIKRITAEKLMRRETGQWTAANIVVEPAGGASRTVLEGTRSDRELDIPAADFTVEKLKTAPRPAP